MSIIPDSRPATLPPTCASPPISVLLTVIILSSLFILFFLVHFCRCFMQNYLFTIHSPTTGSPVESQCHNRTGGLDPLIIQSFPTFTYLSVKEYRKETYGLECSICLLEFEDVDVLRLMTICCHVFHQECIDLWLVSHKTCPACRRVLDIVPPIGTNNSGMRESINEDDVLSMADSYTITIKDDNNDLQDQEEKAKTPACNSHAYGTPTLLRKFSRSNSTGHSIVNMDRMPTYVEDDKFTLKLPEHVKAKLCRGHNWSQSCISFGEYKSKTMSGNGGFREGA